MFGRFHHWRRSSLIEQHVVFGPRERLICGSNVRLANALINTHCGRVTIGDHSFMGHDVLLLTGTHDIAARRSARQATSPRGDLCITIGKGVWIASGCLVIGPCTIGDDVVVTAGCVVDFDVPPGKIVRRRQDLEIEDIRFDN